MHDVSSYWLRQWMDAHGVVSVPSAQLVLARHSARADLIARAGVSDGTGQGPDEGLTIVAGRALDLSGDLDVYAWDMMKQQVDELFHRVWHYFDRVLIVAADARAYAHPWANTEAFDREILLFVQLLLYLREIGAEDLVRFIVKPAIGREEFAPETPFVRAAIANPEYLAWLENGGQVSLVEQHDDHFHYTFNHPQLEHTQWGNISGDSSALDKSLLLSLVSQAVIARFASRFASDLGAATENKSALGIGINFHASMATAVIAPSVEQVMFNLKLPTIEGIQPATLIKLREDEKLHFAAFRSALRVAAQERIPTTASAAKVAHEIERDIIEPALVRLHRSLKAAERILAKKASLRIGMGSLATTCGLISANPLLVTAGVGTILSTLGPLDTHADAQSDASMDDMYFLFRASALKRKH
jgi:hypothetical protein